MIVKWPVLAVGVLWISVVWAIPLMLSDRRELVRLRSVCQSAGAEAGTLRNVLIAAQEQIARLEQELQEAKEHQGRESKGHRVFRRVGLDTAAPRFVIDAARKEFRRRLHPDLHPVHRKLEAERRFKEAEAVFDEIWRVRGFSN
ncbi:hypothetical protein [Microvirga soli]|uniref:hypothetical protein n=1 Tax=Microvirga soli TaxID=1854496 RepID=UPI00191ED060|nr:hypothetical protein [Microvirga soli]